MALSDQPRYLSGRGDKSTVCKINWLQQDVRREKLFKHSCQGQNYNKGRFLMILLIFIKYLSSLTGYLLGQKSNGGVGRTIGKRPREGK